MTMTSNFRRLAFSVLALAGLSIAFTSCLKNKDEQPQIPAAGLLAFNLAPDQQSVVIQLSGNTLTNAPLGFGQFTGVYQNIYIGNRSVKAYDYPDNNPLTSGDFTFAQDKYYSYFLVGYSGHYRNVISLDSLGNADGKAYVRYINAVADSVNQQAVTITAGGSSIVNENAAFGSLSGFKAVAPGDISISVKGNSVDASRTINLSANKVYTILLQGVPGATDDTKKVQVKYIENGTLSNSGS